MKVDEAARAKSRITALKMLSQIGTSKPLYPVSESENPYDIKSYLIYLQVYNPEKYNQARGMLDDCNIKTDCFTQYDSKNRVIFVGSGHLYNTPTPYYKFKYNDNGTVTITKGGTLEGCVSRGDYPSGEYLFDKDGNLLKMIKKLKNLG